MSLLFAGFRLGPATALAAVIGNFILLGYFWQIGFMPTDLVPLFGLGVLVSMVVLATMLACVAFVTAAAFLPRLYELPALTRMQIAAIWLFTTAVVVVAWLMGALFPDHLTLVRAAAGILSAAPAIYFVTQALESARPGRMLASGLCTAAGAFLGIWFLILVVKELLRLHHSTTTIAGFFVLGLVVLSAFSVLLTRFDDWGIGAAIALVMIVLGATAALTVTGYVPQRVATLLGVRYDVPVELRVPLSTCQLLVAATPTRDHQTAEVRPCDLQGNTVKAQVDVRLGNRWLIRVLEINGAVATSDASPLTLPDAGTEMVLPSRPR